MFLTLFLVLQLVVRSIDEVDEVVGCKYERTTPPPETVEDLQFERYPLTMLLVTAFATHASLSLSKILREMALLRFMVNGPRTLRNPVWRTFFSRQGPGAIEEAERKVERRIARLGGTGGMSWLPILVGTDDGRTAEEGYLRKGDLIMHLLHFAGAIAVLCTALNIVGGAGDESPSLWTITLMVNIRRDLMGLMSGHVMAGLLLTGAVFVITVRHQATTKANGVIESDTILIRNIRPLDGVREHLVTFFSNRGLRVVGVKVLKDSSKTSKIEREIKIYRETIELMNEQDRNERLRVWYSTQRAVEFYERSINVKLFELNREVERDEFSGAALVTFESEQHARKALGHFGLFSIFKSLLLAGQWSATLAPPSDDIIWTNVVTRFSLFSELGRIGGRLLVILIFTLGLTGPALFVEWIEKENYGSFDGVLKNFILPIAKTVTNRAILKLLNLINSRERHVTKTSMQIGKMNVNFYFQIASDLVFPMLNVTNFWTLLQWTAYCWTSNGDPWPRFECLLRPSYGIQVTRAMLASTLIDNAVLLLRLPQLAANAWASLSATTAAEAVARHANREVTLDVAYRYVELLYHHALAASCVMTHPLVTVFSVPCMHLRFRADRECLRNVYSPARGGHGLHRWTVPLLLQPYLLASGTMVVFNVLRGASTGLTLTSYLWFQVVSIAVASGYAMACRPEWFGMVTN